MWITGISMEMLRNLYLKQLILDQKLNSIQILSKGLSLLQSDVFIQICSWNFGLGLFWNIFLFLYKNSLFLLYRNMAIDTLPKYLLSRKESQLGRIQTTWLITKFTVHNAHFTLFSISRKRLKIFCSAFNTAIANFITESIHFSF